MTENEYNVDLQSLRDLTNKLTSNGYLIDRAAQWEYAFDAVQDLVMIVNPNLNIKFVNKAFSERLDMLRKDFLDKNCFQILHCPNCKRSPGNCLLSYGKKPERVVHDDLFVEDLDGWFNFSHSPIYDEDNHLLGFICILHDVTERKKAELALKESEEKYRHLIKYAPAGIYEIDFVNDKFIRVNDVMCINTGYSEHELLNTVRPTGILTERSLEAYQERLKKIFNGEEPPTTFEVEVVKKDGDIFWANLNVKFIRKYGKIVGASVISHNITERKKVEEELRRIAQFPEENPHPVIRCRHDGVPIYTNCPAKLWLKSFGGRTEKDFLPPTLLRMVKKAYEMGEPIEKDVLNPETGVVMNFFAVNPKGEDYVNLYGLDVTDRKNNEALMKSIFKAAPAAIGLLNENREIQWSNAKLREMTGYREKELAGQSVKILYPDVEEYEFVGKAKQELLEKEGVSNIETVFKRKDGKLIKVLLSEAPINTEDWSKGITFTVLDMTNF